jgi:hypothetical protein
MKRPEFVKSKTAQGLQLAEQENCLESSQIGNSRMGIYVLSQVDALRVYREPR